MVLEFLKGYVEQKEKIQISQQVLPIHSNYNLLGVRSILSRSIFISSFTRQKCFPERFLQVLKVCPLCVLGEGLRFVIGNIFVALLILGNTQKILATKSTSRNTCLKSVKLC